MSLRPMVQQGGMISMSNGELLRLVQRKKKLVKRLNEIAMEIADIDDKINDVSNGENG